MFKKFLKWSITPVGADRIESTFWRRTYWVVAYTVSLYVLYREVQDVREELKTIDRTS